MSNWYTSDLHLGHTKVAGFRGFADKVDLHDQAVMANWKAVVQPDDIVWVLGDVAVQSVDKALGLISELPGRKHLIAGNHDKCHPYYRDSHNQQKKYLEVFDSVQTFARRKVDGVEFLLSHFPYTFDYRPNRYMQYRLRDEGSWLVHGHLHSSSKWAANGPREIHVGVDAWKLSPVPEKEILRMIKKTETKLVLSDIVKAESVLADLQEKLKGVEPSADQTVEASNRNDSTDLQADLVQGRPEREYRISVVAH